MTDHALDGHLPAPRGVKRLIRYDAGHAPIGNGLHIDALGQQFLLPAMAIPNLATTTSIALVPIEEPSGLRLTSACETASTSAGASFAFANTSSSTLR